MVSVSICSRLEAHDSLLKVPLTHVVERANNRPLEPFKDRTDVAIDSKGLCIQ